MGILTWDKKFVFEPTSTRESSMAQRAAFQKEPDTLRWVTRNASKAAKLRRFANKGCEDKFKKTFITYLQPPECIVYPDHLSPKSWQIESAWHCLSRSVAYNSDEAGLGKTISTILCINSVPGKALVICPPFLKYNWCDEINKWSVKHVTVGLVDGGNADERVFNAEVTVLPDSLLIEPRIQEILSKRKFEWLFVDEAHRFCHSTTKRTQALAGDDKDEKRYHITQSANRIVFLSGTPVPNGRPIELYPLLSRVAPESIGFRSLVSYGKTFCGGKQLVRHEGHRNILNWDFRGATNLKQLRHELKAKLLIRHLKKDVLKELGPKTRKIVFLDYPDTLHAFEKKILKNYTFDELIAGDYSLGDIATYRREVGRSKILQSFSYIHQLLENSSDKLVVFAHHIEVVTELTKLLDGFGALEIRGGLTAKEKDKRVKLFQNDPSHRVIIGNIEAMGLGLTLTKAPGVVFVESSWIPGANEQAEDRVHRLSQNQNVYIRYLVLRGSMDERMLNACFSKDENIREVVN